MNEVARMEDRHEIEPHEPRQVSEAASILAVIERAALNPQVDIDKMQRLLDMHEAIQAKQAKAAYAAALSRMQPQLPAIEEHGKIRDGQGKVRSTYALWEDINEKIKPVLAAHGFALSFRTDQQNGSIVITGVLSHEDGHSEQTAMTLPADSSGSKNAVQAIGSSVSYGKRYTAAALLNLTSRGEDDDGQAAGVKPINEEQVAELRQMISDFGANEQNVARKAKVERLEDIPAGKFDALKQALNDWARQQRGM